LAQGFAGDGDVHVHLVHIARGFIDGDDGLQRRKALGQRVQARLQPAVGNGRGADNGHEVGVEVGGDAVQAAADDLERLGHAFLQQPPGHGQLHPAPLAPEQLLPDVAFQLRNLVAHRRLRHAQLVGGARVIAQPRRGLKTNQQLERGQVGV
jgi:hypothetical protein